MSYLQNFHYQFFRGGGQKIPLEEVNNPPESQRLWVFLHGLMGYSLNWRKIIVGLSKDDWILVYDQRGHGQSFKPAHGYSPKDYAEDLRRILDEVRWQKIFLVGHSMGGRNAFLFSAWNPTRVHKLVIEDMGPEGDPKALSYYEKLLGSIPTPFPNKESAKSFFNGPFLQIEGLRENIKALSLYLYSNIIDQANGQADWRFSRAAMLESVGVGRSQDYWREFQSIDCPILLIRGQKSVELSVTTFNRMVQLNANVTPKEVANAGHWVHYDQPQEFISLLKDFANRDS